jgi:hypothetical protein
MCFETECEICAGARGEEELLGELKKRGRVLRSRLRNQRRSSAPRKIARRRPRRRVVVGALPGPMWPPWWNLGPAPVALPTMPTGTSNAAPPSAAAPSFADDDRVGGEPEPQDDPEPMVDSASADAAVDDEAMRPGMLAELRWKSFAMPGKLESVPKAPGIYIATLNGVPVYVGMSENLNDRWVGRMQGIRPLVRPFVLWCGLLSKREGVSEDLALRGAEHAAIRLLKRRQASGADKIVNVKSIEAFTVAPGRRTFFIKNPLPKNLSSGIELDAKNKAARFDDVKQTLTIDPGGVSPEYISPWRSRRP